MTNLVVGDPNKRGVRPDNDAGISPGRGPAVARYVRVGDLVVGPVQISPGEAGAVQLAGDVLPLRAGRDIELVAEERGEATTSPPLLSRVG